MYSCRPPPTYGHPVYKNELETVNLDDPRLSNVWGKDIYRISLKAEEKKMTGNYKFVIQQVK